MQLGHLPAHLDLVAGAIYGGVIGLLFDRALRH